MAILVKKVLPEALLQSLQIYTRALRETDLMFFDNNWKSRYARHNDPLFSLIHQTLSPTILAHSGLEVKPSYVFLAVYQEGGLGVPKHIDRAQCQYTLDLCLEQEGTWPLFIAGERFDLEPGSAVFYRGNVEHWREPLPPHQRCNMVFFHFIDANAKTSLD